MKFKFIGVPGEDHDSIDQFGLTFPLNKGVEVSDEKAIRKLTGSPYFASVGKPAAAEPEAANGGEPV